MKQEQVYEKQKVRSASAPLLGALEGSRLKAEQGEFELELKKASRPNPQRQREKSAGIEKIPSRGSVAPLASCAASSAPPRPAPSPAAAGRARKQHVCGSFRRIAQHQAAGSPCRFKPPTHSSSVVCSSPSAALPPHTNCARTNRGTCVRGPPAACVFTSLGLAGCRLSQQEQLSEGPADEHFSPACCVSNPLPGRRGAPWAPASPAHPPTGTPAARRLLLLLHDWRWGKRLAVLGETSAQHLARSACMPAAWHGAVEAAANSCAGTHAAADRQRRSPVAACRAPRAAACTPWRRPALLLLPPPMPLPSARCPQCLAFPLPSPPLQ